MRGVLHNGAAVISSWRSSTRTVGVGVIRERACEGHHRAELVLALRSSLCRTCFKRKCLLAIRDALPVNVARSGDIQKSVRHVLYMRPARTVRMQSGCRRGNFGRW